MMTIFRRSAILITSIVLLAATGCGNKSALVKPSDAKPAQNSAPASKAPTAP